MHSTKVTQLNFLENMSVIIINILVGSHYVVGLLKLQACANIPATILLLVHAPLLILVCHSRAFLLIQFSIYLSCHILVIHSHSHRVILLNIYLYIRPSFLHHLRCCHTPMQRLR
jgi:hypothetical protein